MKNKEMVSIIYCVIDSYEVDIISVYKTEADARKALKEIVETEKEEIKNSEYEIIEEYNGIDEIYSQYYIVKDSGTIGFYIETREVKIYECN